MAVQYTDLMKLKHAKIIAKEGGCFIVEKGGYDDKVYILYRENKHGPNVKIGSNKTIDGILRRTKTATKTA